MAFIQADFLPLSGMANSSVPRIFLYQSSDSIDLIKADDYFLNANQVLRVYDRIFSYTNGNVSFSELIVTASGPLSVTTQLALFQEIPSAMNVVPGVQSIEFTNTVLNNIATIPDAKDHHGLFHAKHNADAGPPVIHSLRLTSGTFNGSDILATFNQFEDALTVWFGSDGNGTVININGTVALT